MKPRLAYLDHNATAPLLDEAREATVAALGVTGNPSSVHGPGRAARALIEEAREAVAEAAGARPGETVFTSGATEAIGLGVIGGARHFSAGRIVVGASEHAAVLRAAEASGLPVAIVPVDANGVIDLGALAGLLADADAAGETALVAIQAANNETGVVQPLEAVEVMVGPSRHALVVDAVQVFGKRGLDFSARATDMMAVSGHKIGAPAGAGALFVKSHADGVRLVVGGGQERGRRGGTEAVATIAGFGAAAKAFPIRYDRERVAALSRSLADEIMRLVPDAVILAEGAERLESTIAFLVPGLANATALMAFDLEGVALSSGSACSSGKVGRSHVLAAMGVDPALAECALRVSLGWSSTENDIAVFSAALESILSRRKGRDGKAA